MAEHSLYVIPAITTVLKAASSNPKQATISPSALNATANHTYAFTVEPLAYGRATLTISSRTTANHIFEIANAPNLYVANFISDSSAGDILVFPADANGDVSPSRIISGSNTQLGNPLGIAADCFGNIYVASGKTITRYPASASGNVSPTQVIDVGMPEGMALDSAGHIFVYDNNSTSVAVYAPNATGNATPLYRLRGGAPTVDDQDHLSIARSLPGSISTYSATTSGRPPALLRTIIGSSTHLSAPVSLAISRHHYIWALDNSAQNLGVWVFAPGATGNATPTGTISGSNTRFTDPTAITFDSDENRYITDTQGNTIFKFGTTESGNVAPISEITGPHTQLADPIGILVY